MSFRHLPPKYARRLRGILAVAYAFAAYAGVSALVWTPVTISGSIGMSLTYLWGLMALAGGLAGVYGVSRNQWRIERWSAPLAAGGLGVYALTVWTLTITETTGRLAQASVATFAFLMLVYRATEVDARAKADREEHDATYGG